MVTDILDFQFPQAPKSTITNLRWILCDFCSVRIDKRKAKIA